LGIVGENYYADFDNAVRYPELLFIAPSRQDLDPFLIYPLFRRFYYDGIFSARYEFGFMLNAGTVDHYRMLRQKVLYSPELVAKQVLEQTVRLHLQDGRIVTTPLFRAGPELCDAYILSSTSSSGLQRYPAREVGQDYVSAGQPFVFIRCSPDTPIDEVKGRRTVIRSDRKLLLGRSGVHRQQLDLAIQISPGHPLQDSASERLVRIFYTQIRALLSAHSFFLRQHEKNIFRSASQLRPAVEALLKRVADLEPVENDERDAQVCRDLRSLVAQTDVSVAQLSSELERTLKVGFFSRLLGRVLPWLDRKTDTAVEAAATAATEIVMRGSGP
jgi:hypothetical protein